MYPELFREVRCEAFIREFYRNCPRNAELSEMLALELTREQLPWQVRLLAEFGDLLFNTGTRMKKLAQPRTVLSQEML
jgi:hypothetical protein